MNHSEVLAEKARIVAWLWARAKKYRDEAKRFHPTSKAATHNDRIAKIHEDAALDIEQGAKP